MMQTKVILYVEDEEPDILLMRLALRKSQLEVTLHSVMDGEAAQHYLSGSNGFENREQYPFPDLVLLDLNIPRAHGLNVLKWIREQPSMATLPVVVYTSSEQPKDVAAAQKAGANDYQVKPSSIELIAEMVKKVIDKWAV